VLRGDDVSGLDVDYADSRQGVLDDKYIWINLFGWMGLLYRSIVLTWIRMR